MTLCSSFQYSDTKTPRSIPSFHILSHLLSTPTSPTSIFLQPLSVSHNLCVVVFVAWYMNPPLIQLNTHGDCEVCGGQVRSGRFSWAFHSHLLWVCMKNTDLSLGCTRYAKFRYHNYEYVILCFVLDTKNKCGGTVEEEPVLHIRSLISKRSISKNTKMELTLDFYIKFNLDSVLSVHSSQNHFLPSSKWVWIFQSISKCNISSQICIKIQ